MAHSPGRPIDTSHTSGLDRIGRMWHLAWCTSHLMHHCICTPLGAPGDTIAAHLLSLWHTPRTCHALVVTKLSWTGPGAHVRQSATTQRTLSSSILSPYDVTARRLNSHPLIRPCGDLALTVGATSDAESELAASEVRYSTRA